MPCEPIAAYFHWAFSIYYLRNVLGALEWLTIQQKAIIDSITAISNFKYLLFIYLQLLTCYTSVYTTAQTESTSALSNGCINLKYVISM